MIPEKRHRRRMLLRADRRLDDFLVSLGKVADESQKQVLAEFPRHIRRWNVERAYRQIDPETSTLLSDPAALSRAIDRAIEKGILGFLNGEDAASDVDSRVHDYVTRFNEILDELDRIGDERRIRSFAAARKPVPDDWSPIHPISSGDRSRGERFSHRYDSWQPVVSEIGQLVTDYHDDPGAGEAWLREFRAALAPQLFKKWWADDMLDWLESVDDVAPVQRRVAEELHQQFQTEKRILEIEAFEAAVAARRRHSPITMGKSELKSVFYDRVAALNALHDRTLDRLRELLDEHQQPAFEQAMEQVQRYHTSLGRIRIPISGVPSGRQ